jgi:class 3 adenylate cyclase/tetratricopeptide (TPR) repeat protein
MNDIGEWLGRHGLGQYADLFAANDIDIDVLPALTDLDLKELGLSLGHRRRLLAAVGATAPALANAPAEAERRQLTVLFADLVGSTALAGRLDPEDMREVIRSYQDACAGAIARFHGVVAKFMGDGVIAYFGFPQAHENDAERSVRAGLDVVDAVSRLRAPDGTPLRVRVGIATGLVVVGDLIGKGEALERAVVGETPNLAARLQDVAEPNSVVVAAATRHLAGGLFNYENMGQRYLKGIPEPIPVWRVIGESLTASRFEATRAGSLIGFVGREQELALLLDRWEQAKCGAGQVVLVRGEPGIGKSRLVEMMRDHIGPEPHRCLRLQCSPHHTDSSLYPVIGHLRHSAGFAADDTPERRLATLEALLTPITPKGSLDKIVPLIAALLSVPTEKRYPPISLAPDQQKELMLQTLSQQIVSLAQYQPVLWVLEDAHWIDPTTLELLRRGVERIRGARVMAVVTGRPEFMPTWIGAVNATTLKLSKLRRMDCMALVEQVTGGKALPDTVLDHILTKTDGIPLFIEELAKTVLESGLLREEADRFVLDGPLPPLAIPATLHDSLMARLDRLAPVKQIAQIGAALGREFGYELLAAVADEDEVMLRDALNQLVEAELLYQHGMPPLATYVFKHALVQDAAYGSLLRARRQQLHARIADALEYRFQPVAQMEPEVVAHHFTQAGLFEPALDYWHRAGTQAARRSANVEAASHLHKALDIAGSLAPRTVERDIRELDLCIELSAAMIATRGNGAPECRDLFKRARTLCDRIGDTPMLFPVLYGQWTHAYIMGHLPAAMSLAEQFVALVEQALVEWDGDRSLQDRTLQMVGSRMMSATLIGHGRADLALPHLDRMLAGFDPVRHSGIAFLYGQSQVVASHIYHCLALGHLGFQHQARERAAQAIATAETLAHFNTIAFALFHAALSCLLLRDWREAEEISNRLIDLGQENRSAFWTLLGRTLLSAALVGSHPTLDGVHDLRRSLKAANAIGWCLHSILGPIEAEALGMVGERMEALEQIEETAAFILESDQRLAEAECHRVRAILIGQTGAPIATVEAELRKALDIARSQNARTYELRAATDLARLWLSEGRRDEARSLLNATYGWFTEGFDGADLREAQELIESLSVVSPFALRKGKAMISPDIMAPARSGGCEITK